MTDNLAIWQKVETTDPKYTKPITGRGYNGTSTNATYLVRKATSVFGPCGIGWGVNVLAEGLLDGADGSKVHRVHIRLWYILDGKRGEVEHFGQTEFCGKRASGKWFTDEEAPKKSMTDAMLKALSLIGFAADIHLGMYDDNKYVADLRRNGVEEPWDDHDAPGQPEVEPAPAIPRVSSNKLKTDAPDLWGKFEKEMRACQTTEELKAVWARYATYMQVWPDKWQNAADDEYINCKDSIKAKAA